MSLTYGYDLKDGDKMLEAPIQAAKILEPLIVPGGALINHFPICAITVLFRPCVQSRVTAASELNGCEPSSRTTRSSERLAK